MAQEIKITGENAPDHRRIRNSLKKPSNP